MKRDLRYWCKTERNHSPLVVWKSMKHNLPVNSPAKKPSPMSNPKSRVSEVDSVLYCCKCPLKNWNEINPSNFQNNWGHKPKIEGREGMGWFWRFISCFTCPRAQMLVCCYCVRPRHCCHSWEIHLVTALVACLSTSRGCIRIIFYFLLTQS